MVIKLTLTAILLLIYNTTFGQIKAKIPVVFHVLYTSDEENKKISDSLILNELEGMKKDFLALNEDITSVPADFKNVVGNPLIEFVLADTDPIGNLTSGIIRIRKDENNFTFSNAIFDANPLWDVKKYLNIYIGLIRNGKTEGYVDSNTPWLDPTKDAIGLNLNSGIGEGYRLLTHETGHWLGLSHIFNSSLLGRCRDDGISDTPLQKKETGTYNCPNHPSLQCGHAIMFMNFMDYSKCRVMFTVKQVEKMHETLYKYRSEFLNKL
jgi:hypothetical protein